MKERPKGDRPRGDRRGPPRSGPPRSGAPRSGAPRSGPARGGPARGGPPRSGPPTGARSGPRARAAQDRAFGDPYQRAERPRSAPRERLSAPGLIRLDPDVARVFLDAESVNEALRMVIRLARFAGGRAPAGRSGGERAPRTYTPRERPDGEAPVRGPRFEDPDES